MKPWFWRHLRQAETPGRPLIKETLCGLGCCGPGKKELTPTRPTFKSGCARSLPSRRGSHPCLSLPLGAGSRATLGVRRCSHSLLHGPEEVALHRLALSVPVGLLASCLTSEQLPGQETRSWPILVSRPSRACGLQQRRRVLSLRTTLSDRRASSRSRDKEG